MGDPISDHDDLTKNQTLVLNALGAAEGPLSAYAILDLLRDEGFRAPPQVYRALERLVSLGLAHRLESLNAFVACQHPSCSGHKALAFTICEECGDVAELSDPEISETLGSVALRRDFSVRQTVIELRGRCSTCLP